MPRKALSLQPSALLIIAFTLLAMLVMGYHPGLEDDAIYLSAVKRDLNPNLYPHDSQFFLIQSQATVFDHAIAAFVRVTHLSVAYTELLFQFCAVFLIITGCLLIARHLFNDPSAQCGGVALIVAMLTLPVAGTALNLADQHLHPRNLASGLVLIAVSRILAGRYGQSLLLLLLAFVLHPIMAALGISFCLFLSIAMLDAAHAWLRSVRETVALTVPLSWIFEPPTPEWRRALATRGYYFLSRWTWYEWLGVTAPLVIFCILWRVALRRGDRAVARFSMAVFTYGVFQLLLAIGLLGIPALERLRPMQPMRFLQLIYFFLALIGGCLIGKYLLKTSLWRWAVFLVAINGGMFTAQRAEFRNSKHLELPGIASTNSWLQAFAWIRENTPVNAYFAMDPWYMAAPGEDFHSFRALAERSQLADMVKDPAVVTQVPELGSAWQSQVDATSGWRNFKLADFERLKSQFGVDWVVVSFPAPAGLDCRWHNEQLSICRIPD